MKNFNSHILCGAALLVLASCGGGGGGSSNEIPRLEGVFAGSLENGTLLNTAVLDDGTFWSTYSDKSGNFLGMSRGQTSSKNGQFTLSFTNYEKPGDKFVRGAGSGTYTPSSAVGSLKQDDGETQTFQMSEVSSKNYVYRKKAVLAAVAGAWSGDLLDGETADVQINNDGIFAGTSSDGCQFSGKFTPRSENVNVFDISFTFGGAPCAFPNEGAFGIGVDSLNDNGKHQLLVTAVTLSLKAGTLFYAERNF